MKNEDIEFNVGKRNIKTTFKRISLKKLHFYPANPRISSILIAYKGELTDEKIHDLMDEKQPEATRSLFRLIKKDGLINEPVIVYNNLVLEGNTRLWVARELFGRAKTEDEKKKWEMLPCRLIKDYLADEEINHILCSVHIKKKKDWSPFEQACYFHSMYDEGSTYRQIKEITDFNTQKIKIYIEVYKEMEKNKAGIKDWNRYYEAYKDKEVRDVHKTGKYDVFKTIKKKTKEGKMGTAQDSRKLKKVLKSKRATKMFFEGDSDIKRAYEAALVEKPEEGDPLLKRITELVDDLKHIPFDKMEDIKGDKSKKKIVKDLATQMKKLCNMLDIKY